MQKLTQLPHDLESLGKWQEGPSKHRKKTSLKAIQKLLL